MKKPVIGLTTSRFHKRSERTVMGVNEPYTISVINAAGIPVLVPQNLPDDDLELLVSQLDGILFTGGYDIDPHRYGNPPHRKVEGIDKERDGIEICLVQLAVRLNKPFFGICRGCQIINVALGGSLYEDLSEQLKGGVIHDRHDKSRSYLAHPVAIESGSQLMKILADAKPQVNSLHHQGVRRLAPHLKVSGTAPDGLIEAFELPDHPFGLAVQWHPEELQEHESMRRLLQAFILTCLLNHSNQE